MSVFLKLDRDLSCYGWLRLSSTTSADGKYGNKEQSQICYLMSFENVFHNCFSCKNNLLSSLDPHFSGDLESRSQLDRLERCILGLSSMYSSIYDGHLSMVAAAHGKSYNSNPHG